MAWTRTLLGGATSVGVNADATVRDLISTGTVTSVQFLPTYGGVVANQGTTSGAQFRSGSPAAAGSGVLLWLERHADGGDFQVRTSNAAGTADITHFIIPGATNAPTGADDGPSVDFVDVAEVGLSNTFPGAGNFQSSPQLSLVGTHDTSGEHQWQVRAKMISTALSELVGRLILDGAAAVEFFKFNEPATTETALFIRRNVAGVFSLERVSMGAIDSGGAGFKYLRVPN